MKSLFEQLGGTYHEGEDGLLYPDLLPPKEDAPTYGRYGRMRCTYLKEHRPALHTSLLLTGKLNAHLNEIDTMSFLCTSIPQQMLYTFSMG